MIYTDVATGERTRKIRAHRGIINTLDRTMGGGAGIELVATGSDDGTVKIWEGGHEASKQSVATFEIGCPVTAVCWSADGSNLYIGALDNEIHVCTYLLICVITMLTGEPPDLRHPQASRSVDINWSHRHPDFNHTLPERVLHPLSFAFVTNNHSRRSTVLPISDTHTPSACGFPRGFRKHAAQGSLEQRRRRTTRRCWRCRSNRYHLGCREFEDPLQGLDLSTPTSGQITHIHS